MTLNKIIMFLAISIYMSFCNAYDRLPEKPRETMSYIAQYLPENPIIIECGGCNGEDTENMVRIWPKSTIYTFEPVPQLFNEICHRTKKYPNIFPFQIALADFSGKMTFHLSTLDTNIGASSLLPPAEILSSFDGAKFIETIQVNTLTLDDWVIQTQVNNIDFMWLDMQGYELNMLQASELAKNALAIYTEVSFIEVYQGVYLYPEVKKWMTENGFELIALDFDESLALGDKSKIKPGIRYQGNALFINRNNRNRSCSS